MVLQEFAFRNRGGNSHDRRVARRHAERQWREQPGRFDAGDVAKVTVTDYGQRYKGSSVTVLSKHDRPQHWVVKSSRRVSPLVVADEHLEKVEGQTRLCDVPSAA